MRFHTRGQYFFYGVSILLIVLLLLVGFGLIDFPWRGDTGSAAQFAEREDGPAGEAAGASIEGLSGSRSDGGVAGAAGSPAQETRLQPAVAPELDVLNIADNGAQLTDYERRNINVYQRMNPGVVNITTETLSLNWFLEPVPSEGGTGSGSIIDTRGYILTNYHVVKDAYKVFVNLYDGSQYEGEVIGKDPETDLAVIEFNPGKEELVTIPFGDSSHLKVGQIVLAIGNPFGYDRTLTTGIISGLGRPVKTSRNLVIRDMIQTDASINPGNSGGPLLDTGGNMIGINTMIYSPSGGSVGIGFAVPVNTARRVVPQLIEYGKVLRGWIDIVPVQLVPSIVRYGKLPVSKGIMVSKVVSGSTADRAGLRGGDQSNPVRYGNSIIYFGGDIIVGVDGMQVSTLSDLFSALEDNQPGETVPVEIIRNGRKQALSVVLSERPAELEWE